MLSRRGLLRAICLSVYWSSEVVPRAVAQQAWPCQAVRLLVAYPPGGVSDMMARVLAEQLSATWGVQVRVENRPGASGTLALRSLLRSAPDGHTLAFAAVTAVALLDEAWNDTPRLSVVPVAGVMRTPMLLVGTPALKASTFAEMLVEARQVPGGLRWATTGTGTTGHSVLQRIASATGIRFVHVPYKGGGQQITDALGGHFELLSTNVASRQLEALHRRKLRALAVGAPQRLPVLPQVPTFAELGYAQANLDSLFGLFAPPHTPESLVERVHDGVAHALREPSIREKLLAANNQPFDGSVVDFSREVLQKAER
ncbi:tripartite tricarboxylate transporter substrate binding protein [Oryzisolibacter sp. LB2S]|uniref:Bug family tripartite tricarboxylate transporter substrate binding protein n=1 Tax=Alicycliphilus soli TaxID=3228789 RepID=UPI003459A0F7